MKVCYLNYVGSPTTTAAASNIIGGLNTILFNLAYNVSLLPGNEVRVVYRDDGSLSGGLLSEIKIRAGEPTVLSRSKLEKHLPDFINSAIDYLLEFKPNLVHTSGSEAGQVMCVLRARGIKIPWVHTNYATVSVRRSIIEGRTDKGITEDVIGKRERECLQVCDHVIALSKSDQIETSNVFAIPLQKISVVSPGVDHSIFYPDQSIIREKIIVSAGRMSKVKDFPFLLRSFSILKKLGDIDSKLIIIGGNSKERFLLGLPTLAEKLGVSDYVNFVDGVSQAILATYFRRAIVFAAVSKHETFGLLPVEARACGTPFVARANSGYLSVANDGFGGYFCNNNSERNMAEKILKIINLDQVNWFHLSQQAESSTAEYNWLENAKKSSFIYTRVIKEAIF